MGDIILKCPLCCDKTFDSKDTLVKHLANILVNLSCPVCSNKWPSLGDLIEHLTLDNCQSENGTETLFDISSQTVDNEIAPNNSDCNLDPLAETKVIVSHDINEKENNTADPFTIVENQGTTEDGSEIGRMYVELLTKQLAKPCLQTQELKLVKDNGVSRYVIMTSEDSNMSVGSTVVTKQNNDGTISMTTVKDLKMETDPDTVITQENETEDNQEEVYSCNTCGVSFTSVIDHIQNYHNDQDVVVEEPLDEENGEDENGMPLPMEYEVPLASGGLPEDKQAPRRMITETGDIVETPVVTKTTIQLAPSDAEDKTVIPQIKEEVVDKEGRVYTRRYMQIDKNDIIKEQDKTAPYHNVVIKDMQTMNGQMVKVYHCVSCNVYVSSLDEFKVHPCRKLKYNCSHCPVSYENSKSLCAHMKVHKSKQDPGSKFTEETPTVPALYECEICSTVFPTNKSLKLHKRMHDPIKSRPIEPPVESAEGTEVSQDKYLCPVCLKMIPVDYRIIHQNSHKTTNKFNCDICNKKFNSSEYLDMHMTVHSTDKVVVNKQDKSLPYTCLYCERRFARPHEKVKHERIHTGEKPHSCEICGKSFRVSYCLTLHMRTHTGARPYACPHCGKRFKAHSVYNHHLLTHSDVRAYKCPYCPKAFKTSVQLAGHKNSHTKPFSCQHCNRPFASLYAVRVHTETHARQNNLKFSCSLCGATYARAFALKDHVKQVHMKNVDNVDWVLPKENNLIVKRDQVSGQTEGLQLNKDFSVEVTDDNMVLPEGSQKLGNRRVYQNRKIIGKQSVSSESELGINSEVTELIIS